ncbi:MAG: signal peptidase II [Nanoarchaeota archaeon]|nr:signal peptidase II [Nanoarchaeota archaeon]
MKKAIKAVFVVIALIILDQVSKLLFTGKIYMLGSIGVQYAENRGAAFGIMQGFGWLFIALSVIVLIGVAYFYAREKNKLIKAAFTLILAGTFGNLIDRIFYGYVRDFIAVWIWPNFNLADSFNVVGAALIVYALVKGK